MALISVNLVTIFIFTNQVPGKKFGGHGPEMVVFKLWCMYHFWYLVNPEYW